MNIARVSAIPVLLAAVFSSLPCIFFAGRALAGEKTGISSEELDRAIEEARAELEELREASRKNRMRMETEREGLLSQITGSEGRIGILKEKARSSEKKGVSLRAGIEGARAESDRLVTVREVFLRNLRAPSVELSSRLNATLVGLERPDLVSRALGLCERLKSKDADPARAAGDLAGLALEEIRTGSRACWFQGEVVDRNGSIVKARIFRVGEVAALCVLPDGKQGILVRSEDGEHWRAMVSELGSTGRRRLSGFFSSLEDPAGDTAEMPADVSGGLALSSIELGRTLDETFTAGGFVMWPLLCVAIGGIIIALERAVFLARVHLRSIRIMQRVESALDKGQIEEAEDICRRKPGPVGRVLLAGLRHRHSRKDILEDVLQESILHETPRLERFMSMLGVLAMIAPLLGLLGTVTGMISTFQMISAHGSGDSRLLSGGISEALITTQAGLVIAVPLLLMHAYFSGRVNHILEHIEANATRLVTLLVSGSEGKR